MVKPSYAPRSDRRRRPGLLRIARPRRVRACRGFRSGSLEAAVSHRAARIGDAAAVGGRSGWKRRADHGPQRHRLARRRAVCGDHGQQRPRGPVHARPGQRRHSPGAARRPRAHALREARLRRHRPVPGAASATDRRPPSPPGLSRSRPLPARGGGRHTGDPRDLARRRQPVGGDSYPGQTGQPAVQPRP